MPLYGVLFSRPSEQVAFHVGERANYCTIFDSVRDVYCTLIPTKTFQCKSTLDDFHHSDFAWFTGLFAGSILSGALWLSLPFGQLTTGSACIALLILAATPRSSQATNFLPRAYDGEITTAQHVLALIYRLLNPQAAAASFVFSDELSFSHETAGKWGLMARIGKLLLWKLSNDSSGNGTIYRYFVPGTGSLNATLGDCTLERLFTVLTPSWEDPDYLEDPVFFGPPRKEDLTFGPITQETHAHYLWSPWHLGYSLSFILYQARSLFSGLADALGLPDLHHALSELDLTHVLG